MAIYDTEEEQLEQLKKWWEANQTSVLAGAATAVVLISGWNYWNGHQSEQRQVASMMYEQLSTSVKENNLDAIDKLAEQLIKEHGSSSYADIASLQLAKNQVQKNDLEAAKSTLQGLIKRTGNDEFKHIARLRLLQVLLALGQYEQGLQIIAEIDPAKTEGFSASYDELQGDLYVAMGRQDEARNAYQSALRNDQANPLLQFKLDDLSMPAPTEAVSK